MEAQKTNAIRPDDIAADTHTGLVRECNEDSFFLSSLPHTPNVFVAVADGIGGHDSGDVASMLCMREMLVLWQRGYCNKVEDAERAKSFLAKSINAANEKIFNLNAAFNIQHPMGTTVVAGVFLEQHFVLAHAGDSRCYRLRNGVLERLTNDHSYIAELIKAKVIRPDEAKTHPFAHVISRSVGPIEVLEPEINIFERKPRDRYLFCSDGLTTQVEEIEIEMTLYDASKPRDAVRNLLYAALRNGGDDNITILCVFT